MQEFIDLIGIETDLHLNYCSVLVVLLIWLILQSNIKTDQKEIKNQFDEVINPDIIDYNYESLSREIEANRGKIELCSLDILNIESSIKSELSSVNYSDFDSEFLKQSEAIETHFRQLRLKYYDIEKEQQQKCKLFEEIKLLYSKIWEHHKEMLAQKPEFNLNLSLANEQISLTITESKNASPNLDSHRSHRSHRELAKNETNITSINKMNPPCENQIKVTKQTILRNIISKNNFPLQMQQMPQSPPNQRVITERLHKSNLFAQALSKTPPSKENRETNSSKKGGSVSEQRKGLVMNNISSRKDIHNQSSFLQQSNSNNNITYNSHSQKSFNLPRKPSFVYQSLDRNITKIGSVTARERTMDAYNSEIKDESKVVQKTSRIQIPSQQTIQVICSQNQNLNSWSTCVHHISTEAEEKLREQLESKDKMIKDLQEQLASTKKSVGKLEEQISILSGNLKEVHIEYENKISAFQGLERVNEEERQLLAQTLISLGEACEQNKLKLEDIKRHLGSIYEQSRHKPSNPGNWICTAQAYTIESLLKHNAELSDLIQRRVPPHIFDKNTELIGPSEHPEDIEESLIPRDNTREETTIASYQTNNAQKSVDFKVSQSELVSRRETQEERSSSIEGPIRDSMLSPKIQHKLTFNTFDTQQSPLVNIQDSQSFVNPNPYLNILRTSSGSNQQIPLSNKTKTNGSLNSSQPHDSEIPQEGHFKRVLSQRQMKTDGLDSGREIKKKGSITPLRQDFFMPTLNRQPLNEINSEPPSSKSGAPTYMTFQKNSFAASGTNLNKILFGQQNESHSGEKGEIDAEEYRNEEILNEELSEQPNGVQQRDSLSGMEKFHQHAQISNLHESIAQQLIENSKKPEKALQKVSSNIQAYKSLKERINMQIHRNSIESEFCSGAKSSRLVSPLKSNRGGSSTHRPGHSPAHNTYLSATRGSVLNSSRQNSQRGTVGYDKIFRKNSDYKYEERNISSGLKNIIKQKRKILESPSMINLSQKFDVTSPYHPMYTNSMLDTSNKENNKISVNASMMSVANISRISQRNSFMVPNNWDHNSTFETKNTSMYQH